MMPQQELRPGEMAVLVADKENSSTRKMVGRIALLLSISQLRKLTLLALFAFAAKGCYGPQQVHNAKIIYSAAAARPPIVVGRCMQNRYLLDRDFPLELAEDERTGDVRVTAVQRDQLTLHGGVWYWEVFLSRKDDGSSVVLRSNSSMWGPFADDYVIDLIKECSGPL